MLQSYSRSKPNISFITHKMWHFLGNDNRFEPQGGSSNKQKWKAQETMLETSDINKVQDQSFSQPNIASTSTGNDFCLF